MKKIYFLVLFVSCISVTGCSKKFLDNSRYDNLFPEIKEPVPPVSHVTLKDKDGWTMDTMANGLIHYQFAKYIQTQTANQFVNVVEIDLTNPEYELEFVSLGAQDTLSAVAANRGAIVAINGTYEMDASYIKTNGTVHSPITLSSGHLRYWKHEGAISYNSGQDLTIEKGTKDSYAQSPYLNIFSGSPMLVDDYKKVGEDFIGDVSGINLNSLDYEDYRRHQGVRHPRTVVAVTEDKKLLLVTIDGRFPESAGMTAKEVTQFMTSYFTPQYALNMDGGGSTTMFVKDKGFKGVINYPTDNGVRNHYGQRMLRTFILVKKKGQGGDAFAGGDGTETNPYLIATAAHLQSMHTLNWSNTETNPYYFKLTADIDMIGRSWTPLNNQDPYARYLHFDGDGHVIRNLKVGKSSYGSLFGVLFGSCKNLGLVDVDIESSNGAGAFGGYLGLRSPDKVAKIGVLENCFSTGKVTGTDAVGGLIGNVGKRNTTGAPSMISNCFSAAEVTATATANGRAGGIAGIVYDGGVVENCFASGKIVSKTASGKGAGGVVGWTDSKVKGLVSFNVSINNDGNGTAGRIASAMGLVGGAIAQGENCWASEEVMVIKNGIAVPSSAYVTGEVTVKETGFDGETKTKVFLKDMNNYNSVLGWKLGPGNSWSSTVNSKGKPILQWLFLRGDYESFYQ
ncbi:phosphodiester glycosidase family protein [Sphingobacterium faecale]|uniref:Phosphodiester glycosidase family protein n=1 Tax=Sphingobacterium faecale TaxID=2803775 RepID=A0ABS1R076_9SPHI|nr:phosphodiester glycosidase family protein [Sphingobacterium faecale]MBL1408091.1 phosphodiester glycosidase family protein [Sphingobacterium faecale]